MKREGAKSTWPVETETGLSLRSHKIHVECIRGPLAGKVYELKGPEARIGSGTDCHLVIPDRTVSHVHVCLRIEGDAIRVLDMKSRNGTYVDDVRIKDAYARPDSTIVLGASAMRLRMLKDEIDVPLSEHDHFGGLLGRSIVMRRVYALLELFAVLEGTVLLEGETGTGKEVAAAAIHGRSPRKDRPFVVFDCSAVPANLIESELFGHVSGAFTGAVSSRKGRFKEADGGTLFLDEIGELPLELQPKLLRALETRVIRPLGAEKDWRVDVRIIAATNRDLAIEVDKERFREDLYYRLAVLPVRLPPLRERVEDIPLLVRHFEKEWCSRPNPPAPLPDAILEKMKSTPWPGNVRELRNRVELLLSLGLPGAAGVAQSGGGAPSTRVDVDIQVPYHVGRERLVEEYTKAYFIEALRQTDGNVSRAAQLAAVGRAFVQKVMKHHGITRGGE
ncbi:sigma 54-interacting transcriptional regulator [Polyangium jinanense]|uniref:Sigma 54-dependent Fis family transcriptional regulator n=1 Tax=Polyangium jinanense TaxID=2829994 RepID=A0A9X4AVP8_9BACT|nr:sigma 54-interacting transcriptional regulator [Polyangium jinanense]MDC3959613.1 sigma 54-dependent Fis family transcriptional regulator [Polyangium jinanense]MDC3986539.1 sigma 54-dependent Fis family transcriptional regulator [Polyangium jinanense]